MLKPKQIARIKVLRYAHTASASRSSPIASGGRVSRLVWSFQQIIRGFLGDLCFFSNEAPLFIYFLMFSSPNSEALSTLMVLIGNSSVSFVKRVLRSKYYFA